jgi:hypothetical protein
LPIRLNSLAAPEGDEPFGAKATMAMQQMCSGGSSGAKTRRPAHA